MIPQEGKQIPAVVGEGLQGQRVCEFSRAHPKKTLGMGLKGFRQLTPEIVLVGPDLENPVLKVGLEDTVGTLQGAGCPNMDDPIAAATVMLGSGTKPKESAFVLFQI